ncbi:MAG: hypothetical protein FWD59_01755 [Micrococcales bacterium]|nr:hypothetical protein [Micrococcales bacterium]
MEQSAIALSPLTSGDSLMGRYMLTDELMSTHPWAFRWLGIDRILRRTIEIHLLIGPHVDDAIDAARRAALVRDHRLVRVIDAGRYGNTAFVLTEPLLGRPLPDFTPLAPELARCVAGEVASAMEAAQSRGVFHLTLRPELVYLGEDPALMVGGLGWDSALWGQMADDGGALRRQSAADVVALLYAALTGRWPGRTPSFLPPAPRTDESPVPPSDLTTQVPSDLDTLCRATLDPRTTGPATMQELIDDLGPWIGRDDSASYDQGPPPLSLPDLPTLSPPEELPVSPVEHSFPTPQPEPPPVAQAHPEPPPAMELYAPPVEPPPPAMELYAPPVEPPPAEPAAPEPPSYALGTGAIPVQEPEIAEPPALPARELSVTETEIIPPVPHLDAASIPLEQPQAAPVPPLEDPTPPVFSDLPTPVDPPPLPALDSLNGAADRADDPPTPPDAQAFPALIDPPTPATEPAQLPVSAPPTPPGVRTPAAPPPPPSGHPDDSLFLFQAAETTFLPTAESPAFPARPMTRPTATRPQRRSFERNILADGPSAAAHRVKPAAAFWYLLILALLLGAWITMRSGYFTTPGNIGALAGWPDDATAWTALGGGGWGG